MSVTRVDKTHAPMRLVYDQRYVYLCQDGRLAQCWLRVYKAPGRAVVIATEVDAYPRQASATRMAVVATQIYRQFGLPLDDTVWLAHTPARGACIRPYPNVPEQFEEVAFTWTLRGLQQPHWTPCRRTEVETLIGQRL